MIGAFVKDKRVVNLIVVTANSEEISEIEKALDCEIHDASVYGLQVGDVLTSAGWTRNAGGEQMILPKLEPEQYDSYTLATERAVNAEARAEEAEAQLATVAEATADEALAILTGEDVSE